MRDVEHFVYGCWSFSSPLVTCLFKSLAHFYQIICYLIPPTTFCMSYDYCLFWNDSLYLLFYFMSGHNEDDKHRMIYFVAYMGDSPSPFLLKPCSPGNLPTRSMCPLPTCHGFFIIIKSKPMHSMTCMIIEYLFQNLQQDCKASQTRTAQQAEPGLRRTQAKTGPLALRITKCELWGLFEIWK